MGWGAKYRRGDCVDRTVDEDSEVWEGVAPLRRLHTPIGSLFCCACLQSAPSLSGLRGRQRAYLADGVHRQ